MDYSGFTIKDGLLTYDNHKTFKIDVSDPLKRGLTFEQIVWGYLTGIIKKDNYKRWTFRYLYKRLGISPQLNLKI